MPVKYLLHVLPNSSQMTIERVIFIQQSPWLATGYNRAVYGNNCPTGVDDWVSFRLLNPTLEHQSVSTSQRSSSVPLIVLCAGCCRMPAGSRASTRVTGWHTALMLREDFFQRTSRSVWSKTSRQLLGRSRGRNEQRFEISGLWRHRQPGAENNSCYCVQDDTRLPPLDETKTGMKH